MWHIWYNMVYDITWYHKTKLVHNFTLVSLNPILASKFIPLLHVFSNWCVFSDWWNFSPSISHLLSGDAQLGIAKFSCPEITRLGWMSHASFSPFKFQISSFKFQILELAPPVCIAYTGCTMKQTFYDSQWRDSQVLPCSSKPSLNLVAPCAPSCSDSS